MCLARRRKSECARRSTSSRRSDWPRRCSASPSWSGKTSAMPESLANKLKEIRGELGLTQAQLAEAVGVTRKTINTVENGVFVPSTLLALKIARALQRPVEALFSIASD